ncbi:hybrid sensor histidine kinase/response regulator transcription factor [Spirosoma aerophilum]
MTTILVVDDELDLEPLLKNWFRREIRKETYAFRFAHNGYEALTLLQDEPSIDLLLLDINMPKMDGLTLLTELPTLDRLLATVMVSAYGDMENIRTAMNRGAFDFVTKPIDFSDLNLTIKKTAAYVQQLRESQQLKVINELKTRFFDNITHEFRTPLTLILSPVEKMLQRYQEPEPLHTGLLMVERNAQQLLRLINQLLDSAKLESGHLVVSPTIGNLDDFVGQIVQTFQPVAHERSLELTYQSDLVDLYSFDANKVEQIVYNLIANALKFTYTGGVRVELKQGASVQLVVSDTGIGIASEKLPFIFNRFYQVLPSSSSDTSALPDFGHSGTGIGLALVKELTELMNGTVTVQSRAADQWGNLSGTTFTVELPLLTADRTTLPDLGSEPARQLLDGSDYADGYSVREQVALDTIEQATSPDSDKALVLVVEDNRELCAFIARELSTVYRVLTAGNGEEGWKIAKAELPDIVLTDVMMPLVDGYELTRRLKTDAATNHIAVVMLTAKTALTSRIEGLKQGADDYISKPFHIDELHLRLRNLLSHQQKLQVYYQNILTGSEAAVQAETVTDKFLHKLQTLIEGRLDDSQFGVTELAHEIGMSRRTLHRKLTSIANMTINDFIRQYRLRRATQFLRDGHNISETAYLVGYESPAYFTTIFKEVYKKTPSEYMDN